MVTNLQFDFSDMVDNLYSLYASELNGSVRYLIYYFFEEVIIKAARFGNYIMICDGQCYLYFSVSVNHDGFECITNIVLFFFYFQFYKEKKKFGFVKDSNIVGELVAQLPKFWVSAGKM